MIDVVTRLGRLRVHVRNGVTARHQPLALLWALGEARREHRLHPWVRFRDGVGPLLVDFGAEGSSATPEYPFWHLHRTGVWEVHRVDPTRAGFKPRAADFERDRSTAGFTEEAYRALRDPTVLAGVIGGLRARLGGVDVPALLERVGLDGYDTASGVPRRAVTREVVVRDRAKAVTVKALHGDRCQFCATRLAVRGGAHSEAAHIRGLGAPHHGADVVANMLCLCPNCHTRFDLLALFVDADGVVCEVGGGPVAVLRRHEEHPVDAEALRYQRRLCGVEE